MWMLVVGSVVAVLLTLMLLALLLSGGPRKYAGGAHGRRVGSGEGTGDETPAQRNPSTISCREDGGDAVGGG